jgi:glycosyltransferase involved in cell wall biosynthesis
LGGGSIEERETDFTEFARNKGVKTVIIEEMGRNISIWNDVVSLIKLYKLIQRVKPTIVHTHTAKAGAIGRIASLLAGVPVIIHTFHGHTFHSYFSPLKSKMFVLIERAMGRITDKIIVISQKQFQEICGQYRIAKADKFQIIPLGLELDKFLNDTEKDKHKAEFRENWNIPSDAILIGIIGRLVPIKKHVMFLKAAQIALQMASPNMKLRFMIVGDGELRTELENYATKLGIDKYVTFTGWQNQMKVVYDSLDIVALTSLNEGTPLTLIEAMASGKPVITTNVGGIPDFVKDGYSGILVPSNSPDLFANKLLELTKDKAMRDMLAANGRNVTIQKYHYSRLIRDIEELYEQLLVACDYTRVV